MELKNRIKSIFAEGLLIEKSGSVDSFGKKKIVKGIGRKALKKSKIKGKRKNNYKTQDARRILASKHGISKALKKVDNKYEMTYDEIAKLMRHYTYAFNKDKGKWFRKKDTDKAEKPTSSKSQTSSEQPKDTKAPKESKKAKTKVVSPEDITPNLKSDKTSSIKKLDISQGVSQEDGNYLTKESMKSYQARLISYLVNQNTEEGGWYDAIQILESPQKTLEFYLPKEKIYEFLESNQITWIEERKVWIDIDGNYPISDEIHNGRQGITCRATLANEGYVNFLDVEDSSDEEALDLAKELGYTWADGNWTKSELPTATESVQKRVFPELVTQDIIGIVK